jgi:glycogen synthase
MHAIFVLPRFFPYRGGYENSLLALARFLIARGHRVTVFTTVANDLESLWLPGHKTYPPGEEVVDGIVIHRLPICYNVLRRRATRLLGLLPYWKWKAQFWKPSFRVKGLREALHATDADIFHIGPLPYNNLMFAGLEAARSLAVPVVATPCVHFGETDSSAVSRYYAQPHQIRLLARCDRVLCMTQAEKDSLHRLGVPDERLAVAPHGFDAATAMHGDGERFRSAHKITGPVVLHLGMKAYEKGSNTVVEAMKILWARGCPAWLVMAGSSFAAFDDFLRRNAQDCPRLLNLGPFNDEEKPDLLAAATLVVQPSRVESLGLILLEAWAAGKAVIAADIPVSRELVTQSGGGVVTPFGDAAQLAEAIQRLLDNAELRSGLAISGQRKTLAEYESGAVERRIAEEFERLVPNR